MTEQIPNLRGGHRETVKWVAVPVSVVVFVGGLFWNAAKYPTREEFVEQAKEIVRLRMDMVETRASAGSTKESVSRMSDDLKALREEMRIANQGRRR